MLIITLLYIIIILLDRFHNFLYMYKEIIKSLVKESCMYLNIY